MTKAATLLSTVALTFAFSASAYACGMKNSASHEISPIASIETKTEDAMSTFDPKQLPVFENETEASDEPVKTDDEKVE